MHSWLTRILVGAVAMASAAGAPATVALASPHHARHHHVARFHRAGPRESGSAAENSGENATEADNDASQQAAACQKAGIDPNGANVQYDGTTRTCTTGGSSGANVQQ